MLVTERPVMDAAIEISKGYRYGTDRLIAARDPRQSPPVPFRYGHHARGERNGPRPCRDSRCHGLRPNARGLAVSQGKGLTLDAAKASAVMESIIFFEQACGSAAIDR